MKTIVIDGKTASEVTPQILAELFAGLDSEGQAAFFNHVDLVASTWTNDFCFQLQSITDDQGLTLGGRRVMQSIGDYSHWGLICHLNDKSA